MRNWNRTLYHRCNVALDKVLVLYRKKKIVSADFSIISNNCWAGHVYRRYGLPYLTPTVGLYFFADDYVKLCSDLQGYMSKELEFIPYTESKHRKIIEQRNQTHVPIARLGDVEIVFLHYSTAEEAARKWQRRVRRINYDNIIYKFSQMNYCTDEHLEYFDQIVASKKICFIPRNSGANINCAIRFMSAMGDEVDNDTAEYSRYINLTKMINAKRVCGKHMEGQWDK